MYQRTENVEVWVKVVDSNGSSVHARFGGAVYVAQWILGLRGCRVSWIWVDEIMSPIPALRSSRTGCGLHQVGTFFLLWSLLTKVPPGCSTPKGGWGCLMSPSCLESQGCHLIPLSYLLSCFFCLVLLLFLSCHFSANGPFSWLFFPLKTQIVMGYAFLYGSCWAARRW